MRENLVLKVGFWAFLKGREAFLDQRIRRIVSRKIYALILNWNTS